MKDRLPLFPCLGAESHIADVQVRQTLVCTSLETHRAIVLPDDLRTALEKFQQNPKEISS